ncbi:MAG: hypothetical protein RI957_1895, partial [Verrucomicrobiota bacterium]
PTAAGSITVAAPTSQTTILNKLNVGSSFWRMNSGSATLNFAGAAPTIDVADNGTLRMEVRVQSSAGITKTGNGLVFSNLQSASAGFTGPLTIAAGTWQAGNNFALGDQKTVNIQSGATLNMSSLALGATLSTGTGSVARGYTMNIAGDGSGSGAIIGSASILNGFSGIRNLTLTANASIGGTGTYDIGFNSGSINGGGNTLTKLGSGTVWLVAAASNISYQVSAGTLVASGDAQALGGSGGSVTVASGATLATSGITQIATPLTLNSGASLQNLSTGSTVTWTGSVAIGSGVTGTTFTGASTANTVINAVISGTNGTLVKSGANTLTLSKSNTYTGLTKVTQGTLVLASTGSISQSSGIEISSGAVLNVSAVNQFTVQNGQTLSGGGTITGDVLINGAHTPGFSPGLQTFSNNLSYGTGSSIVWELNANTASLLSRGTSYDGINVAGNLSFNAPTTLNLSFNLSGSSVNWNDSLWSNPLLGTSGWKIFDVDGTMSGFNNLSIASINWLDSSGQSLSSVRPGYTFGLHQAADGIYLNYTVVPESSTTLLLAFFAGATAWRRKRSS